jgi:hypothetical protein
VANAKTRTTKLQRLEAENEQLRAENKRLRHQTGHTVPSPGFTTRLFRKVGSALFVALAVALLIAGNILFWTGNTVVKPDRFKSTVTPIIKDSTVQTAVASYTTEAIFNSVDVPQVVADVLPSRADFLAPTIASSLRGSTQGTLKTVLARPQFQDRWNNLLTNAQSRFINQVKQNGGDGAIDVNELYQQLDDSLTGTKLSFLANRKLPEHIGSVQLVKGSGISTLHRVITHIDMWRTIALILFLICGALSIYLSRIRRRGVIRLALFCAAGLFLTLVALRITREVVAGNVQAQYAEAVRRTVQIIFHPLAIQTATLLCGFLVVALVAWLTGPASSAVFLRSRTELLFAGKLHNAIFGEHESAFTRWVGAHKHLLEWSVVGVMALLMLIYRLTLKALVVYLIVTLVLVLVIELLGAPVRPSSRRTA